MNIYLNIQIIEFNVFRNVHKQYQIKIYIHYKINNNVNYHVDKLKVRILFGINQMMNKRKYVQIKQNVIQWENYHNYNI